MKRTSKLFLATSLAFCAGLPAAAHAANPDEVVVSRDNVVLGSMIGHARIIDSSRKNVRVEIFRSGAIESFITPCKDIKANKERSDRASLSDKLTEAANQFESSGFTTSFDDTHGYVDRDEGYKRARAVAAERIVETSNALLFAAANICENGYAITVTKSGVVMGELVGRSDLVYSQLLQGFVVSNNKQEKAPFRNIGCMKLDSSFDDYTPQERLNWIGNIEKNLRGLSLDNKKVEEPEKFMFQVTDGIYGTAEDHAKRVRFAVATRLYDGFSDLEKRIKAGYQEHCLK